MQIIWTLILTVCSDASCASQTIQWFDQKPECVQMKAIHEELPTDGHWKSITYSCSMLNGEEA